MKRASDQVVAQVLGTDQEPMPLPKLVLGLLPAELTHSLERYFRGLGWRVCTVESTSEIRRKAHGGRAAAIVLPVSAFQGESAFLTCAKLVRSLPQCRVVLIGPNSEENERFALFAGAAGYVAEDASATEIAAIISGKRV